MTSRITPLAVSLLLSAACGPAKVAQIDAASISRAAVDDVDCSSYEACGIRVADGRWVTQQCPDDSRAPCVQSGTACGAVCGLDQACKLQCGDRGCKDAIMETWPLQIVCND